ncbi:MAG TPA: glycoside hydrolase family 76 protein [Candidatus Limnocylindria bacterium]|nr:glycoside hydrolase family 76 protein [Candidatus Limnocylindria bacterium]
MKRVIGPTGVMRAGRKMSSVWMAMLLILAGWCGLTVRAFTSADADAIFQSHAQVFYQEKDGKAWFKESTEGSKKTSYWMWAEQLEMVLDAYERTRNPQQIEMFTKLFQGFLDKHGKNWSHNEFNDDIMWMVIACTRAHLLTGNVEFRDVGRTNFDLCFARATSEDLGGGLWWKVDSKSKNACINGPASIAAFLMGKATGEASYLTKATNLFLWERATLFDPVTGRISDSIGRNGKVNHMALTYNQGTFVGAANFLGYTNEAMLAAKFTMSTLCKDGMLPAYGDDNDGGGFNGIGVRWIARFMEERHAESTFEAWLQKNADAAWAARRPYDGLSWCRWPEPTPPDRRQYSFGCSSAVVVMQVAKPQK